MTAPEDQNGLREALARAEAERDAAIEAKAREVVSVGLPDNAKWLLASKDLWHARARAAEAEITRLKEGMEALGAALKRARLELIVMAEAGVNRLADYGCTVDPPERTYGPAVAKIDAVLATLSPKEQP